MDQPDGARPAPQKPAAASGHMRWDISALRQRRCMLATASATPADVVLNFGVKRGGDYRGSEIGLELVQRIALSPLAARHLLATLERAIADYDRTAGRPR